MNKLQKGCGKEKICYSQIEHKWINCGERLNSGVIKLCSSCQEKGGIKMEALNKNKEEIEKIDKKIGILKGKLKFDFKCLKCGEYFKTHQEASRHSKYNKHYGDFNNLIKKNNPRDINKIEKLENKLQERIKTSIQWCEAFIEFLDKVIRNKNWFHIDLEEEIDRMILQFQIHLNWLKEQEKKNDA